MPDPDLMPRLARLAERIHPSPHAFDRLTQARAHRVRTRRVGTIGLALVIAVAGSWGALAALGGGGGAGPVGQPSPTPSSPCDAPSSVQLRLSVSGLEWDTTCWNAPADVSLIMHVTNKDAGVPMNVAVVPAEACPGLLTAPPCPLDAYTSVSSVGPGTTTIEIPGLSAGAFVVIDKIHPDTGHGMLYVGDGPFSSPSVVPIPTVTPTSGPTANQGTSTPSASALPPTCPGAPMDTVTIVAKNLAWDLDCWAAPSGRALTVHFDNRQPNVPAGVRIVAAESCAAADVLGSPGMPASRCSPPSWGIRSSVRAPPRSIWGLCPQART